MTAPDAAAEMEGVGDKPLLRFRLLRPVLEDGVTVPALARASGIPEPTLRR